MTHGKKYIQNSFFFAYPSNWQQIPMNAPTNIAKLHRSIFFQLSN